MADALLDQEAHDFVRAIHTPIRTHVPPRLLPGLRGAERFDVETPAGRIAAWRRGEGAAVLLVHGWEDDNTLWDQMIEGFAAVGRPIVVMELPGHGHSADTICSPASAAAAVRAVAAALGPIDAAVTHSFGGPATGDAVAQGAGLRRLALIAPPQAVGGGRYWERQAETHGVDEEVLARARELYTDHGLFDLTAEGPHKHAAALLLHSRDDDLVRFQTSERIAAAWPGAEVFMIDGYGHRRVAQNDAIVARAVDFIQAG
ncbi:MAG: alpha/beta fold hydrolase [Hyphomonadaceae bacterium]